MTKHLNPLAGAGVLLVVAGLFFLSALIFQVLYNYSVPVVVGSISAGYNKDKDFTKIKYLQACVIMLFCSVVFGGTSILVNGCGRVCV